MAGPIAVPLRFARGIKQSHEPSTFLAEEQFLTECTNFVPEPTGGLRSRAGWTKGSVTGNPATRRGKGIGLFNRYTDPGISQVTPAVSFTVAENTNVTPTFTWPAPTKRGSLILLLSVGSNSDNTTDETITVTATGATVRHNAGTQAAGTYYGWYEYPDAAAQQGDATPANWAMSTGGGAGTETHYVTAWLVEITGVSSSPFDVTATGTGTTTATATTAATAQASELIVALATGTDFSGTAARFTFSTSSAVYSELTEDGQLIAATLAQQGAIYSKAVRATGTQTITVVPSITVDRMDLTIVTYKGWSTAASPGTKVTDWLVADSDATTYDIYKADRDTLTTATFSAIDTNLGSVTDGLPVAFVPGLGGAWYTNASFSGVRLWDGATASAVSGSPVGARCVAIHKSRLWAAGTGANPGRLYWSQAGDGRTWSSPGGGYIDITEDETIEDITPFADALVIGCQTQTYALLGDSPANFTPIRLTGGGAAPGRTVVATPIGCIFAGRSTVYLWDGSSGVEPISDGIEADYGMTGNYMTVSRPDDDHYVYICDEGSGKVWAFDMSTGTWRTETVASATEAPAVVYSFGSRQVYSPRIAATVSLLNFRDFPDPGRAVDYAGALGMSYAATTTELWQAGPWGRWTPRKLFLKLRQRDGLDSETQLKVVATYDGVAQASKWVQPRTVGSVDEVYRTEPGLSVGKGGIGSASYRFSLDLAVNEVAAVDIEDVTLTYDMDPEPT